jgi:hypothetical protein
MVENSVTPQLGQTRQSSLDFDKRIEKRGVATGAAPFLHNPLIQSTM